MFLVASRLYGHALCSYSFCFFFFMAAPPTDLFTLSLHDAFRSIVSFGLSLSLSAVMFYLGYRFVPRRRPRPGAARSGRDRKSTRLNSSHITISYAVFCLKKKIEYGAAPWL